MARINVYLPDDLAAEAKKAGLSVSSLTQDAIRSALASENLESWLSSVSSLEAVNVTHEDVVAAVHTRWES